MSQTATEPQVELFPTESLPAEPLLTAPVPTKPRKEKWPWLIRTLLNLFVALAILTSPIWGFWLLLMYSFSYGPGRGDYPAVAPDADFETRRAWGKKEMFDYFELAEKWVRESSLIAEDVGKVTGVAPIGSPNRFYAGGFTDGAYCVMNLQVIGEKGEGLLTMPEVNVNRGYKLYGISENSTWKFAGQPTELIALSGKSWLQEEGVDTLVDQIREHSVKKEYADVVATCELLSAAMNDPEDTGEVQPQWAHSDGYGEFVNMPFLYRAEMLRRYADSLFQLGRDDDACSVLRLEATLHLDHADLYRYRSQTVQFDPGDLARSIEAARVAIMQLSEIQPDDKKVVGLAKKRTLMAHKVRSESFRYYYNGEEEAERDAIRRSLGDLYRVAVFEAKKSDWLRKQLGAMEFRPKLNHSNHIQINRHGLYCATVVLEVTGRFGKSGTLRMNVREYEKQQKPMDLDAVTPRVPSFPFGVNYIRWTDSHGKKIKLSSKTLEPVKKKS